MAVLPFGRPGIISAAMLGLGRALGETIAVAMVLSAAFTISFQILSRRQQLRGEHRQRFGEAGPIGRGALIASGLVLFVITLVVNMAARAVIARRKEYRERRARRTEISARPLGDGSRTRLVARPGLRSRSLRRGRAPGLGAVDASSRTGSNALRPGLLHPLDARRRPAGQRRRRVPRDHRHDRAGRASRAVIAIPIGAAHRHLPRRVRRDGRLGQDDQLLRRRHDRRPVDRRGPVHPRVLVLGLGIELLRASPVRWRCRS